MTDQFAGIAGHARAIGVLRHQLENDRLSHAYLFHGETGLGKTTVARAFAAAALGGKLDNNPDYWEDDRNGGIGIDEIRLLPDKQPEHHVQSLQAFLSLKPAFAERRVALVTNIGRLPDQTQAILLKTLEEPHPGRVVILTSPSLNPFVVLPTVVSRCQRVAFHPVDAAVVEEFLGSQGIEPGRARELAAISGGRPGWALRAAGDDELLEEHRHWRERLEAVIGAPADVALRTAAELDAAQMAWRRNKEERQDPALTALDTWLLDLRQRMLDDPPHAKGRWAKLIESAYDTRGYLEQNVSPRLALELFLLECRRAA